jgi:hypothetical protein
MTDKEIAKDITMAFVTRLDIINLSDVKGAAKKVGEAYKAIHVAVSATEPPRTTDKVRRAF